uniref:B3 domain-containing protein Os01g0234100-like n=1 Tax=Erigeron canadensis TaxID=72917 RepID=UPI001CB8C8A3|nr:B3 domain-containing protein Os01g0234100-like [Erigeron canadensis]
MAKHINSTPLSSKWKQKKALEIMKKLQKKDTNPKQKPKTVSFDLPRNVIVRYDPKMAASAQPADSHAKAVAIERANEVQANLSSELPSFVKPMLPSQVTGGFWLGLSKKFCDAHLPKHDETVVLVDEDDQEFNTKYLVDKTGLSGGWRGFSLAHKLLEGDVLVFQLTGRWKFKVYIVRVHGLNEIDGALGLLNLVPCGIKIDSGNLLVNEDTEIDLHENTVRGKVLVELDQSEEDSEYADSDSAVSEGLRLSKSVIEFKDIKSIDDFSIVVDGLVIDSEIPKHFQIKYYDLCSSQKTYLHDNLLKGINVKLAVGIMLKTITIADAIRACKVTTTRDNFEIWDKTLKAFQEVGMNVEFLRGRISKLVGLLFDSNELLKAKRNEQMKAEEEMRSIRKNLSDVKEVIKNLDVEIKVLKIKAKKLESVFHMEAESPW